MWCVGTLHARASQAVDPFFPLTSVRSPSERARERGEGSRMINVTLHARTNRAGDRSVRLGITGGVIRQGEAKVTRPIVLPGRC